MSLINNMLKDLEVRKDGAGRVDRPIFQDLHSAHSERRRGRGLWVVVPVLVVLGGAAFYSWNRWGDELTRLAASPAPAVIVAQAPPAIPEPPAPAPIPVPVQESAPAPAVVNKPPKPAARPTNPGRNAADRVANGRLKPARASSTAALKSSAPKTKSTTESTEAGPGQMEKTERPYTAEEQTEHTYQEALRLKAQGNAVEAERQLTALLAVQPKHVKAREQLVGIQFANARVSQAQDTLEQGVAQVPAHLAFRYQLARLYLERNDEARAVSLLEDARRQGHSDPELPAFLAALYQRTGRQADAVKSYQVALAARPQEGRWWVGLGISLETQQDSGAARDAYRHALDTGRLAPNLTRYAEDRLKALTTR